MFTLERLEDRMLMAANVTQSGGTLTITGDNADDAVLVEGTGNAGEVEVFVDTDGDGAVDTSIGTFTGVQNIKVNTKGGDDAVGFLNVEINGSMDVKTGGGDDGVILSDCDVVGKVSMNTGSGEDLVVAIGANAGSMSVKTGGGDDAVVLYGANIAGKLDMNLGGGNDVLGLDETTVSLGGAVKLNGGGGQDLLAGDNANDLQQQLAALGANVKGFETVLDVDDVPANVTNQIQAQFTDISDRLTV